VARPISPSPTSRPAEAHLGPAEPIRLTWPWPTRQGCCRRLSVRVVHSKGSATPYKCHRLSLCALAATLIPRRLATSAQHCRPSCRKPGTELDRRSRWFSTPGHRRTKPIPSGASLCHAEAFAPLPVARCWWMKHVTTFDPQAYKPTPFSPWGDPQGSCQSAEQGDC
jgi:hypothetical protein